MVNLNTSVSSLSWDVPMLKDVQLTVIGKVFKPQAEGFSPKQMSQRMLQAC
ncbi:MAG: hypothetical protein ACTSR0_00295 [Candidatus Asgardarchaeia archaeon]